MEYDVRTSALLHTALVGVVCSHNVAIAVQECCLSLLTTRPAACIVVSCTTGQYIYIALTTEPQCVYGIYCPGGSFDLRHTVGYKGQI